MRNRATYVLMVAGVCQAYGGTGRASDGWLSFLIILGFLGIILGILHLVDYLKALITRFLDDQSEIQNTSNS